MASAGRVLEACRIRGLMLVTAESCTGGLLCGALTSVPGSSDVIDRGYVTYSYQAKAEMLGVDHDLLRNHGAVSEEAARAMVAGALVRGPDRLAAAVTGVAGPGNDSEAKPAGLVHFAVGLGECTEARVRRYGDIGRHAVRLATVRDALEFLEEFLGT